MKRKAASSTESSPTAPGGQLPEGEVAASRTGLYVVAFFVGVCITVALLFVARPLARPTASIQPPSPPPIAFDPPSFDYGTILQSSRIRHEFRLVNNSSNETRLLALMSSCSCTLPEQQLADTVIPPHGRVVVPVTFDSGHRDGHSSSFVTAVLQSKDIRYEAQAKLSGIVSADFSIEPPAVDFGKVRPGDCVTRTVVLRPKSMTNVSWLEMRSSVKEFEAYLQPSGDKAAVEQGQKEASIVLRAPQTGHGGLIDGAITVFTSSPRVPMANISVRAIVARDFDVIPDIVVLNRKRVSSNTYFTIRTILPSRIVHITGHITHASDGPVPSEIPTILAASDWGMTHRCTISDLELVGLDQVNFELEVRDGNGQNEAKSISAQVKCLD